MKISIEAARFQKYLLKYQKEVQQDTEKAVKQPLNFLPDQPHATLRRIPASAFPAIP